VTAPVPRTTPAGGVPLDPQQAFLRKAGRQFIMACYGAARATKLYPPEHAAVGRALEDLVRIVEELRRQEGHFEVRFAREFIFVNEQLLRLDLSNYASFTQLLTLCRGSAVGAIRVPEGAQVRDWLVFLSLLGNPTTKDDVDANFESLLQRLAEANIKAFELEPQTESEGAREQSEGAKAASKRTYAQTVAVTKDVISSIRAGKTPNVRRIKRLVHKIVDQILHEETSLIGLTSIRDYDEYTYTHSVNVCIFSVALGRRIGLTKKQLYELGMAALFHDIGKSRVPLEVLQKEGSLTEEGWQLMMAHPWMGVLALFQLKGQTDVPYRGMICAYEHHMKLDLTGYPKPIRPRELCMISKIVSLVDGYDAATTHRAYRAALPLPAVIQDMRDNPRRGLDPILVKAFTNMLGIYPPGTLVVLDTFELGIVKAANADPEFVARPIVIIIGDSLGNPINPPVEVDLSERNNGDFARTIIKTADPDRYGVRVSDYFI
jgi:HD-GYP domain-containing protein (c-di-GMP phosphodiesterase class II)